MNEDLKVLKDKARVYLKDKILYYKQDRYGNFIWSWFDLGANRRNLKKSQDNAAKLSNPLRHDKHQIEVDMIFNDFQDYLNFKSNMVKDDYIGKGLGFEGKIWTLAWPLNLEIYKPK